VRYIRGATCALFLLAMSPATSAPEDAPDAILSTVTQDAIALLRQGREGKAGSAAALDLLVTTRILPLFDFQRMTQLAMGQNWRLASAGQRQSLTTEFRALLVCTYSAVLSTYRDQTIEFKRLHMAPGDTAVTVKSDVTQAGTERISIDCDMSKAPDGWKVYDIRITGVSLITTHRATFAKEIRDAGVDALIKLLADKNRRSEAGCKDGEPGQIISGTRAPADAASAAGSP